MITSVCVAKVSLLLQAALYSREILPDPAGFADLFMERVFCEADAGRVCSAPNAGVDFAIQGCRDAHSELNADVTAKHQLIQVSEASLLVKLASLFYVSVRKQGVWPLKISRGIFTME